MHNIVGMIYIKDILATLKKKEEIKVKELIRPIVFFPGIRKIGSLLKEFQQKHIHLAAVVDEFRETKGIVTMEDIIEEVVGQIQDESDNEIPIVEKADDKLFKVIATSAVNDINDFLLHPLQNRKRYDTLVGLLIHNFGKIPSINVKIVIYNYDIPILKRLKNAINLVQIKNLKT